MDMTGEHRISAPREQVWQALNDPEVLKKCIPGCEELIKDSDTQLTVTATNKVGPVKARFKGKIEMTDIDPPNGCTISGEGQGGVAGFAKGGADVKLTEDGGETVLSYVVKATVGGKLAQIGSRLVDQAAKKMANEFFQKFAGEVGGPAKEPSAEPAPETPEAAPQPAAAEAAPSAPAAPATAPEEAAKSGLPTWVWAGGLIVIVVALLAIFGS